MMGKNVVVIGTQWGDEGKGKIVDWLTESATGVVRYPRRPQRGPYARHRRAQDGAAAHSFGRAAAERRHLRRQRRRAVARRAVAGDRRARGRGRRGALAPQDLARVSARAADPCRARPGARDRDGRREDRHHRTRHRPGVRRQDRAPRAARAGPPGPRPLLDQARRAARVSQLHAGQLLQARSRSTSRRRATKRSRTRSSCGPWWRTWRVFCTQARERGDSLLFEGAQGALLDIDHGTYPYVTSSNCLAGAAASGCGIGPQMLDYVLGIVKAYATRVGTGPFPTELTDDIGAGLAKRGNEFGSVTGRPRRCGWLDLPALKRSLQLNGVDGLCITKLDVLDGMAEIRVCTSYRMDGKVARPHSHRRGSRCPLHTRVRDATRLERVDRGGQVVRRASRERARLFATDRGADRRSDRDGVDRAGPR